MANRYWRGGSGTWNSISTTNWSATSGGAGGASVPTSADSVFFTLGTTYTVTLATSPTVMDFTVSAGTVTFVQSFQLVLTVAGNFSITGNTLTPLPAFSASTIVFNNTFYGPKTIGTNGAMLGFNVETGGQSTTSCTLSSAFKTLPTLKTTLLVGTLNLNGFDLSTGSFLTDPNGSYDRNLIFGSGNIYVTTGVYCANTNRMTVSKTTGAFIGPTDIPYDWNSNTSGYTTLITTEAPNLTFTGAGSSTARANIGGGVGSTGPGMWDTINFGSTACRVYNSGGILCKSVILNSSVDLISGSVYFEQHGTGTFTSNGCTLYALTMPWSTCNLTLGDALTFSTGITHEKGTLNLNGFNLTARSYTSNGSIATRTINWNNASMYIGAVTTGGVSMTSGTGLTVLNGPGNIFVNINQYARSISWCSASGGSLSVAPNLTLTGTGTATTSINTITNNSWFNNLDLSEPIIAADTINGSLSIGGNVVLSSAATSVFTNSGFKFYGPDCTLNTNNKATSSIGIGSSTYQNASLTLLSSVSCNSGITCSFPYGTLNLNDYNLSVGIFDSPAAGTRQLNFGTGYITLTSTTAAATVVSMANATGFTCTGTGGFTSAMSTTRTFTFGTTGGSTSNAPNLSLTSGASIPTITTGGWFNILDFTGSTCTPAVTSLNLNGLVLASSGTYTNLTPTMRGTGTITTNAKTLPTLTINSSGTTTLGGALTTTGDTTITAGTLNLAGFTLQTPNVTSSSSSNRSITGTGNINVTGDWTISNGTNFTGSNYNINMNNASAKTFAGGNGSYGNLIQAGAGVLTISGSNTFADITATTRPSTITFTAGTTQIVKYLTLSGTTGNLVTINSSTAGTRFNLSKIGGAVNASYLNIQDSNATGGATWKAYNGTNTNSGNNSGWAFVYVAPLITGEFMAFF